MRIRKNAKISALFSSSSMNSSETLLHAHICQLNQSPWDVITFSPIDSPTPLRPPPHMLDEDDAFTRNGSLGDSIEVVDRTTFVKTSLEGEENDTERVPSEDVVVADGREKVEKEVDVVVDGGEKVEKEAIAIEDGGEKADKEAIVIADGGENVEKVEERENQIEPSLCCKNDDKGWKCMRDAKKGHSLCEHHLTLLRNNGTSAQIKSDKPIENPQPRRPRTKKSSSSTYPNDFYYYSGYGPLWGKKRCARGDDLVKTTTSVVESATTPSLLAKICDEEFESESESESESEDKVEDNGKTIKKRGRKRNKARSLKSIM